LELLGAFVKAAGEQEACRTFLKESRKSQGTWRLTVHFDRDGRMFFTYGWKEFAFTHSLVSGFLLTFRHRQGTHDFSIKIFGYYL
jgi:hypothetical protein